MAIGVILIFICMAFIPTGASIEITSEEKEEQTETIDKPDYKFDSVTVELHGKVWMWAINGIYADYARGWRIPIPFTDYDFLTSYCFKFWINVKTPGNQLELVEGYFDITTPNGGTLIVEYDGDTRIEYVSETVIHSHLEYEEPCYYFKGTLRQGVEIYL